MPPPGRPFLPASAWVRLVLAVRLLAVATAVVLLLLHRVTGHDVALVVAVCAYAIVTTAIVRYAFALTRHPLVWGLDVVCVLVLVALSGDWRSPFYLLAVTTLVTPAAVLPLRTAVGVGAGFSLVYLVLGVFVGPDVFSINSQTTLETLATHLVPPVLISFGVAYTAAAMRNLAITRQRAERLAIESERRRIAWELHDSAKARVHAAHLVLSAVPNPAPAVTQALHQLEAATADMDTSLAELGSPLEGRRLDVALKERISELQLEDGPEFVIAGDVGELDPLPAAHAYRIAGEALMNAARHARAARIAVTLSRDGDGAHVVVADDGLGMPDEARVASNGLRVMRSRALTIGAELDIQPGADGTGTVVALHIPEAVLA